MRRGLIHVAIALALVAGGWAAGRAQTRLGDFEIAIDAAEGSTRVECVRGCSLIGSRDVGNPRAERMRTYSFSCSGGAAHRCSAQVNGFLQP